MIRSQDNFGEPISMHYKGKTAYQTVSGGICSLITMVLVAWFTLEQVYQLVKLDDPTIVRNTIYHKSEDFGTRTAKEIHFDLAIGVTN